MWKGRPLSVRLESGVNGSLPSQRVLVLRARSFPGLRRFRMTAFFLPGSKDDGFLCRRRGFFVAFAPRNDKKGGPGGMTRESRLFQVDSRMRCRLSPVFSS